MLVFERIEQQRIIETFCFLLIEPFLWPAFLIATFSFLFYCSLLLSVSFFAHPLVELWNLMLYQLDRGSIDRQKNFLRWHSVGWSNWNILPSYRLDRHLVLVFAKNPIIGQEAIDYVSTTKQKWAAQVAQIELDARRLAACTTVDRIRQLPSDWNNTALTNPAVDIFRIFDRIIEDLQAAMQQQGSYNQRQALNAMIRRIDGYLLEFNRSDNKYTIRFRPILAQWQQIISDHTEELQRINELTQEIDNPYIIGVPLTTNQQIFTGRKELGGRLETLILDTRRPPLLLYGQRRMGKTSLLNNLDRLLPSTIVPLFIDLQGNAAAANSLPGFLFALITDIEKAVSQHHFTIPTLQLSDLQTEPIIQFNQWLDRLENALGDNIALLALDEFEVLDRAFQRNRLDPEDVLGLLRRIIQHRPKFKILIAGSHTLEEFQRWSSYLINVQTLNISYLQESEAIQLIENPIPDFPLRYEPAALQLVLHLTHCHPYLVQQLCSEIIVLKNEQEPSQRRLATSADVEAAVPHALASGSAGFFGDLQTNQIDSIGRAILHHLARQGDGATLHHQQLQAPLDTDITPSLQILLQRDILEPHQAGYRFQVELIRRWFAR